MGDTSAVVGRMMKVVMCLRSNELWCSPDLYPLHRPINRQLRRQAEVTRAAGATCSRRCQILRIQSSSFFDTSADYTLYVFFMTTGCLSVCLTSRTTEGFVLNFLLHSKPNLIRRIHLEFTHTHTHNFISVLMTTIVSINIV